MFCIDTYGCFAYHLKTMAHFLDRFLGNPNTKHLKRYAERVDEINALTDEYAALSDEALKAKTTTFKKRLTA